MVPLVPRVFTTAEPMVGPRVLLMVVPLVLRVFTMVVPMVGPTALEPLRYHLPTPRIPNRVRGVGLSAHEL